MSSITVKSIEGHNSVKTESRAMALFSAHRLIMLYICANFHIDISNGLKDIERPRLVVLDLMAF